MVAWYHCSNETTADDRELCASWDAASHSAGEPSLLGAPVPAPWKRQTVQRLAAGAWLCVGSACACLYLYLDGLLTAQAISIENVDLSRERRDRLVRNGDRAAVPLRSSEGLRTLISTFRPSRHVRQKRPEAFGDRRMRDDRIAELRIGEVRQHCRLHCKHDLIGLRPDHRKADNAVVIAGYNNLHEALRFLRRLCPQHITHRKLRDAHNAALPLRVPLTQPDTGKWRVREHAIGYQSVARAAVPAT